MSLSGSSPSSSPPVFAFNSHRPLASDQYCASQPASASAFHCPRGMLEFWIDPESPYAKPQFQTGDKIVFYCASGWRSALSARTAQDMGLPNVTHISDGFGGWKKAGGPVGEKPTKA